MMVKRSLDFFYFEIEQTPSEIHANMPGQSSLCFLHWAAATLKGLV